MSGLLFNKIAAGVLVVALIGAGGAEAWRRMSGGGASHADAPPATVPHGAEQASAHAAAPEASPASAPAPGAPLGEAAPATAEGSPTENAAPDAPALEVGAVAAPDAAAPIAAAPAVPAGPDYPALFAAANIEDGKALAIKCAMCHDFTDANKTLVGPPLYDLFGRDIASLPGINYSAGPGSLSNVAGAWDADKLDRFLENPKKFAPATFMALPGMNKESERINMMAYIRSLTAGEPKPVE